MEEDEVRERERERDGFVLELDPETCGNGGLAPAERHAVHSPIQEKEEEREGGRERAREARTEGRREGRRERGSQTDRYMHLSRAMRPCPWCMC